MTKTAERTSAQTKLSDTQLIVLSGAAQRDDGVALLPARIGGSAAQKLATALLARKLVRKARAANGKPVWMQNEDGAYALIITKAGRAAIHMPSDEVTESADAPRSGEPPDAEQPAKLSHEQSLRTPRENTKLAWVITLLSRTSGASIDELMAPTGWLPHTTRAALTGLRKRGYVIERTRSEAGEASNYRIVDGKTSSQAA